MRQSEAITHFELYHQLRLAGISVIPEHKALPGRSGLSGRGRADLAIMRGEEVIGLVEVKKGSHPGEGCGTKQEARYQATGLPVFWCCGDKDIHRCVIWALGLVGAP